MYTLSFTLKQHTPMIHFLWEQDGVTLRATEVKPKLDRFIISKNGGKGRMPQNCFIKDKEALNYKMIISSKNKEVYYDSTVNQNQGPHSYKNNTFFGNLGLKENGKDSTKNFVVDDREISVNLIFTSLQIRELFTKDVILSFFQTQNFGTRNNKGNGSFTVSKFERDEFSFIQDISSLKQKYYFDVPGENYELLFQVIDYFYKYIKSGINFRGEYYKSGLLKYLGTMPGEITWEKALIKRSFIPGLPISEYSTNKKELFARALLGLPGSFTYKQARTKRGNPKSYNLSNTITIEIDYDKNKEIERIPSPIVFKPVQWGDFFRVFILYPEDKMEIKATNRRVYFKTKIEYISGFDKDALGNIEARQLIPKVIRKTISLSENTPDIVDKDQLFEYIIDDFYNYTKLLPDNLPDKARNRLKDLEATVINQQKTLKGFFAKFNGTFSLEIPKELDINSLLTFFIKTELKEKFYYNNQEYKIHV